MQHINTLNDRLVIGYFPTPGMSQLFNGKDQTQLDDLQVSYNECV